MILISFINSLNLWKPPSDPSRKLQDRSEELPALIFRAFQKKVGCFCEKYTFSGGLQTWLDPDIFSRIFLMLVSESELYLCEDPGAANLIWCRSFQSDIHESLKKKVFLRCLFHPGHHRITIGGANWPRDLITKIPLNHTYAEHIVMTTRRMLTHKHDDLRSCKRQRRLHRTQGHTAGSRLWFCFCFWSWSTLCWSIHWFYSWFWSRSRL